MVKTSPISQIQHSAPKHALTARPLGHATPFRWWSPSGSCFCQCENLNWFYTHFSASPICFLWSWEETVSLNCIWLLQVISLKPSAGLLGPGDFFWQLFAFPKKMASSVYRLKCVLWGWMKHFIHRKIFIKFHMPVRCRANTIVYTSSEFYSWSISVIIIKCPLYCC